MKRQREEKDNKSISSFSNVSKEFVQQKPPTKRIKIEQTV